MVFKIFDKLQTLFLIILPFIKICNSVILDYSDESNWGEVCLNGINQSPIDLPSKDKVNYIFSDDIIKIIYSEIKILNNLKFETLYELKYWLNLTDYGSISIQKNEITYLYKLDHAELHLPSEHLINGEASEMELQFLFVKNFNWLFIEGITSDPDEQTQVLIISFLWDAESSKDNSLIAKLNLGSQTLISNFDLNTLFSPVESFFYYSGSITSPFCSAPVDWIIYEKKQSISQDQLTNLKKWVNELYPTGNARKVRDHNERKLYYKSYSSDVTTEINVWLFILCLFSVIL